MSKSTEPIEFDHNMIRKGENKMRFLDENDIINKSDIATAEVKEKETDGDSRSQKQRNICEEGNDELIRLETDGWAIKETSKETAIGDPA